MHFTQATSAILATLALSSTVFAGVLKATDSFCSNSAGCVWQNPASWPGVYECSCNLASPDGKSVLLLQGYTDWNYEGFLYNGYSTPGVCNNMPDLFNKNTESMNINVANTPGCWIYTQKNCVGDYAVIDSNGIAELKGYYDKGVQSWICDPPTS
ncbi:hypothetical protein BCIN_10g02890 [Botrytis cinerea B05.10]|uniref:Uncharacterized protein n=3 Tax=Botryotinia fuckeliana TaxID=40559 RepID=A0A384JV77_BOTFB|nr:hypothetical protein BCIN_10g02890 [Botrytis cinerea B05.10]ATZ54274.1 hypothetical protein BCIN_10g02890 [Botrytis cinerea B05.10]EMR88139.1 hypothetical protein BcDW1_3251 [Botrytis cinerea BcDW1]CCD54100.1 hypothetical protein BofuT4_P128000.1 [Botrytis cinerea T4]